MRAISSVADLLEQKGKAVHSIGLEASLTESAKNMVENEVRSLVVLDHAGKLVGLITARDVLRIAAGGGARLDSIKVKDAMAKDLRTTQETAGVEEVENLMIQNRIRHLPVLKGDEVVGVVTRIDVLRHYLDKQHALSRELEGYISGVYPE